MSDLEKYITPEYLLSHGFERYNAEQATEICEMPFEDNEHNLHFREKEFHRQMFVVIFSGYNGDPKEGYHKDVHVQDDAGCGFVSIPFPWWDLPIEYFESVYYGIRGYKPKLTIPDVADAEFEIIQPKLLDNGR